MGGERADGLRQRGKRSAVDDPERLQDLLAYRHAGPRHLGTDLEELDSEGGGKAAGLLIRGSGLAHGPPY